MQEHFVHRARIEVSCLVPENQIGHEGRTGEDMLAELPELCRQQNEPAECEAGGENHDEGRKYPPYATSIEGPECEAAPFQGCQQYAGDQITRDDEEYVHADESTGKKLRHGVEAKDGQYRHGAKAVDISSAVLLGRIDLHVKYATAFTCD